MIDAGSERYVNLATFRKDGREVRTPVWIAVSNDAPVVYTNVTSGKVKRIRNNPEVRVAPCNARGDLRGDWVAATARLVEDEVARDRALEAFVGKYGWQMRLALLASRLTGRYRDRAVLELAFASQS